MVFSCSSRVVLGQSNRKVADRSLVRKGLTTHCPPQAVVNKYHSSQHQHQAACGCQKPGFPSLLSLCRWLPRQSFGSSLLPSPLIVLLRLILPAVSLHLQCLNAQLPQAMADPVQRASAAGARFSSAYLRPRRLKMEASTENPFAHLGYRVSTSEFLQEVTSTAKYDTWRLTSVTWAKALASHMSHEFIQFIAEDAATGQRKRLIADRQETGDWVSITSNPDDPAEMSDMFTGLGSGPSTPYKDRHTLPLPLVSLTFGEPSGTEDPRPKLRSMAELLVVVSERCQEYNPLREHCWWFCESVIEGLRSGYASTVLEEWEWHRYRYSFVICNKWIRRRVLEDAARSFEERCLKEFAY